MRKINRPPVWVNEERPPKPKEEPQIYTVYVGESGWERLADCFLSACLVIAAWIVAVLATA